MRSDSRSIHDGAKPGIEARARELLGRIREDPDPRPSKPAFQSERHVTVHLTDKDVVDIPTMWKIDLAGRKCAAVFWRDGKGFGLFDADYTELRSLVELILKSPWMKQHISDEFLEDTVLDWCENNYQKDDPTSLCDLLVAKCTKSVERFSAWVPIANLETELAFPFGPVRIDRIQRSMIDRMRESTLKRRPEEKDAPTLIDTFFEKFRKQTQGLATVVVDIEAEPRHASNTAIELAHAAIGLLRVFHAPSSLIPWCTCSVAILGSESAPHGTTLLFSGEDAWRRNSKALHGTRSINWQITREVHADLCTRHLAEAGELIKADSLNEFQQSLRTSLLTYSKGLTLPDINDRLVHTLSALEGLLLKDSSEPIQQNLADRMAFLLFQDPQSRMDAVRNLKAVYNMRSRYIHHRISLSDENELETFTRHAGLFLVCTLRLAKRYSTRAEFITAIEKRKYGH
jgi:Apea-like HEPN